MPGETERWLGAIATRARNQIDAVLAEIVLGDVEPGPLKQRSYMLGAGFLVTRRVYRIEADQFLCQLDCGKSHAMPLELAL